MTFPTFLFALLIALFYAAIYHAIRGGNGWRFLLYIGLSVAGLFIGQWVGTWLGWYFFLIGSLNLGMGTLGSITFLIAGEWLSHTELGKKSSV
jgi:hypothetical protein